MSTSNCAWTLHTKMERVDSARPWLWQGFAWHAHNYSSPCLCSIEAELIDWFHKPEEMTQHMFGCSGAWASQYFLTSSGEANAEGCDL